MDDMAEQAETLARAICVADDRDPDVPVPRPAEPRSDMPAGDVPQWKLYEAQARRLIAVQGAILDR